MKRVVAIGAVLVVFSFSVQPVLANHSGEFFRNNTENSFAMGGGYAFMTTDGYYDTNIDLAAFYVSAGYRIPCKKYPSFSLTPEIRLGTGVSDDSGEIRLPGPATIKYDIEMDYLLSFSLRGEINLGYGFYCMLVPSYTKVEFSASASASSPYLAENYYASDSDTSWEFGFGGGIGHSFSERFSAEVMYERVDDVDAYSFAAKFHW